MKYLITILAFIAVVLFSPLGVWAEDEAVLKMKSLCEEGNSTACFRLGERYRILERDNKTSLAYHLKACEHGYITGCTHAGILIQMTGTQYSPQWKKAAKLFLKGCDAKSDRACFNLGSLKYKEGRQKAAMKYWKLACDLGNQTGCHNYKKLKR
ncbi:MAG: tetratricopeptide repeat protein [Nitrospinaceae bacterium]